MDAKILHEMFEGTDLEGIPTEDLMRDHFSSLPPSVILPPSVVWLELYNAISTKLPDSGS
jgi:hypothetical protein